MLGNFRKNRAAFPVRARQIADAHKEFADDFAAHEFEVLAEQLDPFVLIAGAVRLDPIGKAAVALADAGNFARIFHRRLDFAPVADDRCILDEAFNIMAIETGDTVDVEVLEGDFKAVAFFQNDQPGKPCLKNLKGNTNLQKESLIRPLT